MSCTMLRGLVIGLALSVAGPGCRRPPEPPPVAAAPELATVDVAPAPDAAADLSGDVVERARPKLVVAGVLPEFFPREVPLPIGTSLVDFAATETGGFIELRGAEDLRPLADRWRVALRAAGWTVVVDPDAGPWRLSKGSIAVVATLRDARPGSLVRLEVTP